MEDKKDDKFKTLIKNKVYLNDEIEIITPNFQTKAKIAEIVNPKREETGVANTNDESFIKFVCDNNDWEKEYNYALLRTVGIKNEALTKDRMICE